MIRAQLISVGREHVSKVIEVPSMQAVLEECKDHLLSSQVDLVEQEDGQGNGTGTFDVVVGGWRKVGEVKIISQ